MAGLKGTFEVAFWVWESARKLAGVAGRIGRSTVVTLHAKTMQEVWPRERAAAKKLVVGGDSSYMALHAFHLTLYMLYIDRFQVLYIVCCD